MPPPPSLHRRRRLPTAPLGPSGFVAVFAGQCFVDGGGRETLVTTWLLRKEAAAHTEDWKATV